MRFISWCYKAIAHIKPQRAGWTNPRIAFSRPWPRTLRGLALWLFAASLMILGLVNYVIAPVTIPDTGQFLSQIEPSQLSFTLAYFIMGEHAWGWVMVGVGAVAMFCSYCYKNRDQWGYLLLIIFYFLWGMGFLTAWVFFDAPVRSVGTASVWIMFSLALLVISGFPNVPLAFHNRPGADLDVPK